MIRAVAKSFLFTSFVVGLCAANLSAQGGCPGKPLVEVLGTGTPGSLGVPELQVQGVPVVGTAFSLSLSGALPLAHGFLFVGTSAVPTPVTKFGATFFPAPLIISVPFVAGADGGAALASFSALGSEFCGVDVVLQAAVQDAAAKGGAAITAGLHITFGPAEKGGPLFPGALYDVELYPQCVAIADLDQDGLPDLAVASQTPAAVWLLLGHGDGTFAAAKALTLSGSPRFLARGT